MKHSRGDSHPILDLFFWSYVHERENWVTASVLRKRRERSNELQKGYAITDRAKRNARLRDYNRRNPGARKARRAAWRIANPDKWRVYQARHMAKKRAANVLFRLQGILGCRIRAALNGFGVRKSSRTFQILGCTPQFLRGYLERQFKPGMSWDRRGDIHIDHRKPLSSAKSKAELMRLCHYTNLQPLWRWENLAKSDKFSA